MIGDDRARVPLPLAIAEADLTAQGQMHLRGRPAHPNRRDLFLDVERQGARLDQLEQRALRIAAGHHQRRFDEASAFEFHPADRSVVEADPSNLGLQRDLSARRLEGLLQRLRQRCRTTLDFCTPHAFVEQQTRRGARRPRPERGPDRRWRRERRGRQRIAKKFLQPIGRTHGGYAHQLEHVGLAESPQAEPGLAQAPEFGNRIRLHHGRLLAQHARHEIADARQKAAPLDVAVTVALVEHLEFVARALGFRVEYDTLVVRVRGEQRRRFALELETEARQAE